MSLELRRSASLGPCGTLSRSAGSTGSVIEWELTSDDPKPTAGSTGNPLAIPKSWPRSLLKIITVAITAVSCFT